MALGLIGKKCGMTRIFTEDGVSTPVTVIQVENNRVTQLKGVDTDGYIAVQISAGSRRPSRVTKPMAGHYAKAGVEAGSEVCEFRIDGDLGDLEIGKQITVDIFSDGQAVDVIGTTIGKGFAGAVKRHHFRTQDATHGNSVSHRAPGSIGQNQTPGRVFKGKKMAGHLGSKQRTQQNLSIVRVDVERGLLLVSGSVPGHKGGSVLVCPAVKTKN